MARKMDVPARRHFHKEEKRGFGRACLWVADQAVDLVLLAVIILLVAFAVYSIWDTRQIYTSSDAARYETYKPTAEEDSPTFEELVAVNPDVLGWISIYGTGIDYPLVQGENNDEYINKTVTGEFALGGSIFLESTNKKDFSDFNTIIYGHHMEKGEMFGDLDKFEDSAFFNEHEYGSLYYGGKMHGLHVFAMVNADAYDFTLYDPHVEGADAQNEYLNYIMSHAKFSRDIVVQPGDHIVMLSTCAAGTNERYVAFARIEEQVQADAFAETVDHSVRRSLNGTASASLTGEKLIAWLSDAAVALLVLYVLARRRQQRK